MIHSKLIPNGQFNNASDIDKISGLKIALMEQSHSDIFLEVDKPGIYKADALITNKKNLRLAVKTADCMPVLISDSKKVGVIHIGWKRDVQRGGVVRHGAGGEGEGWVVFVFSVADRSPGGVQYGFLENDV